MALPRAYCLSRTWAQSAIDDLYPQKDYLDALQAAPTPS